MKIITLGMDLFDKGILEVEFSGVTTYGEKINLKARYNKDLKMVGCDSAYSSMNNAKYYVEVAKYFQAMLDLEGTEKLKKVFEMVSKVDEKNDKKLESMYDDLRDTRTSIEEIDKEIANAKQPIIDLEKEKNNLEKSKRRCKKQASIEEKQNKIEEIEKIIEEKINNMNTEHLKLDKLELRKKKKEIERQIDMCWFEHKKEIMSIEICL